jgi:hypothetical protein
MNYSWFPSACVKNEPAPFIAAHSVEKEPPDQKPAIAEQARDGADGERYN